MSELRAEMERVWREQSCAQPWHKTRWQDMGSALQSSRGQRYTLKRKSKYSGNGVTYLTPRGVEYNHYAQNRKRTNLVRTERENVFQKKLTMIEGGLTSEK